MTKDRKQYLIKIIAQNDDQIAFEELYRHYFTGLFSFVNTILKDKHHSEEITLDIFFKLWENRKTLPKISNLTSYLYVAAKYSSISFLRKRNIIFYDELYDDSYYTFSDPEQKLISKEEVKLFNKAISSLPPKCRLIFRLIKEERMKYREVAELLGISQKTVEAQIVIATRKLIEAMNGFSDREIRKVK